jgi:hypothetical protein
MLSQRMALPYLHLAAIANAIPQFILPIIETP